MKKIIIYICICVCAINMHAQQIPLYSLFAYNKFIINPAYAGVDDYFQAYANSRYQFVGIENAPVTSSLSFYGPHAYLPMGWGGLVYNDSQGALSKFAVYGAYSYAVPLSRTLTLSFGLLGGIMQHTVDLTKVTFLQTEYNFDGQVYNSIKPDATFGMYVYDRNFYAGVSFEQLFGNKIQMLHDSLYLKSDTRNKLNSHLSILGGYTYDISTEFSLEPHAIIRKTAATPLQFEAGAHVSYNSIAWLGLHVRTGGACVMYMAYNYRDILQFAYAYDMTYSALRKDTFGSHEIVVGIRFAEKDE